MKKKILVKVFLMTVVIAYSQVSFAQESVKGVESKSVEGIKSVEGVDKEDPVEKEKKNITKRNFEDKNPRSSSLDIFHASFESAKLSRVNKERIFTLWVVVENFGSSEDKDAFQSIREDFKNGVLNRYKGRYVASSRLLHQNLRDIRALFESLANVYHQKVVGILEECADALIEAELQESVAGSNELESNIKLIGRNRDWLRHGYRQLTEGQNMQLQERPEFAINHYRVAKMYGIGILKNFSSDDVATKNKIESKYSIDTEDIKRLIAKKDTSEK